MTAMLSLLSDAPPLWLHDLGGVLLHSTWQIVLLGLVYWPLQRAALPARVKHDLGLFTLLIAVVWPAAGLLPPTVEPTLVPSTAIDIPQLSGRTLNAAPDTRTVSAPSAPLAWVHAPRVRSALAAAWLLGAAFMVARLGVGWSRLRRIRREAGSHRETDAVRASATRLGPLLGIAPATLARLLIRIPEQANRFGVCVFGFLRPVLVVPAATVAGLSPAHLDAVLLHELAHLRRRDGLWAAIQSTVDCLLFFHPVARWISSSVREQRERACDDLVIAAGIERSTYAGALLDLMRQQHGVPLNAPTPSATGGTIKMRIARIIDPQPSSPTTLALTTFLCLGLFIGPLAAGFLTAQTTPTSALEDETLPPHLTLRGEVVTLRPDVLRAFEPFLEEAREAGFQLLVLDPGTEGRFRSFVEDTLSAPTLHLLAGSSGTIQTGIQDRDHLHSFRSPDGRVTNGVVAASFSPHVVTADATILDISVALRPNEEVARPSDVPTRIQLSDVVLSRGQRLAILETSQPPHNAPVHAVLIELVSTSEEPSKLKQPVSFAVQDADYNDVLDSILRFVDLDRDDSAIHPERFDVPLTLQAQQVPAGEMLEIVLRMNCLRAELDETRARIVEIPGCEPSGSNQPDDR